MFGDKYTFSELREEISLHPVSRQEKEYVKVLISDIVYKITNRHEANIFVYEHLKFIYQFYEFDSMCKDFIERIGISVDEFCNIDLKEYESETNSILSYKGDFYNFLDVMFIVVISVMKKYNIGNPERANIFYRKSTTKFLEPIAIQINNHPTETYFYGEDFIDINWCPLPGYSKINTAMKQSFLNENDFCISKYGLTNISAMNNLDNMVNLVTGRVSEAGCCRNETMTAKELVVLSKISEYFLSLDFEDKIKILTECIGFTKMPFAIKNNKSGVNIYFFIYHFMTEPLLFEFFITDDEHGSVARICKFHHGKRYDMLIPVNKKLDNVLFASMNYILQHVYTDIQNLNFNTDNNLIIKEMQRLKGFKFRSIDEIPVFNKRI